jgi:TonB family protein
MNDRDLFESGDKTVPVVQHLPTLILLFFEKRIMTNMHPKRTFFSILVTTCFCFLPYFLPAQTEPQLAKGRTNLFGYQDAAGNWAVQPNYARIDYPYSDFMIAKGMDKLQGVLNKNGDTIVPFAYQEIKKVPGLGFKSAGKHRFFGGFLVAKNRRWGLIDSTGHVLVPIEFEYAQWFNDSTAFFSRTGQQLGIDHRGQIVFEADYEKCELAFNHFRQCKHLKAVKDGKMGLIDFQKNVIVPFEFERVDVDGYSNFVRVRLPDRRRGLWNLQGREVLPPRFRNLSMAEHGLFKAQDFESNNIGMIDSTGRERLPLEYSGCDVVARGPFLKAKKSDGLSALFDLDGRRLTDFMFLNFEWFAAAPSFVFARQRDRKFAILNERGQPLSTESFDDFSVHANAFIVRNDDLRAFLLRNGQRVTPFKYPYASGMTSEKQARQLEKELGIKPPAYLIGSASIGKKQVFIDSEGREIPLPENGLGGDEIKEAPAPPDYSEDIILNVVETNPEFPGGQDSLFAFISRNLQYPSEARANGIEGRVFIQFIVEKDGSLSDIKVLRDIGGGCGAEALRIIKIMPKWIPGQSAGKNQRMRFTLPLRFFIQ